ncbi:hypothetical protein EMIHUDRAFT_448110 [Emiliania huxleyi CCMP1516]|uniref:Transcription initiation factor TFIID subunit 1 histone acetyltransferase domain-containing protein n=2 Tax=Emiliania huxleyi TaxID=2903 RepID=A0A0D3ITE8_EMIH1|nr:hypothetical protein EMIHUDRAFT_448110 [Emiliania huxleyi CCMP1516]EOD14533.1 hypothetical protein EMIHUDRAFT_448110 [Emiliania huxleyi CCMP1516]|eukprot:XP_005766962.1 hypothetical protein EMIHUDRAFT_448110 [Emiliania huxleyi CCMP1516]
MPTRLLRFLGAGSGEGAARGSDGAEGGAGADGGGHAGGEGESVFDEEMPDVPDSVTGGLSGRASPAPSAYSTATGRSVAPSPVPSAFGTVPRSAAPSPVPSAFGGGGYAGEVPLPVRGAERRVQSDEELPFLLGASMPPDGSPLLAVESNLFSAPAFLHAPTARPGRKAFLLVHDERKPSDGWRLRRLQGCLLVGQTQPCEQPQGAQAVPRPNTREFREMLERRAAVFLQRTVFPPGKPRDRRTGKLYTADRYSAHPRGGYCVKTYIQDLMAAWPKQHEGVLREQLEKIADDVEPRLYEPRPERRLGESALQATFSPEEQSLLEAAFVGEQRLRDALYPKIRLRSADGLDKAIEALPGSEALKLAKRAKALLIEEELLLAPWALTSNFQAFKHGRCQLALAGPGDPSGGRGEGYSYTRAEKPDKERGADGGARNGSQPGAQGGSADVRKWKLAECVAWLAPHGYARAQVAKLSRADRVSHITAIATREHARGEPGYEAYASKEALAAAGGDGLARQGLFTAAREREL